MKRFKNKIILGDAFEVTKDIPDESIDMCIFSPPYYLQRNYGSDPIIIGGDSDCKHAFIMSQGYSMNPDSTLTGRGFKSEYGICNYCKAYKGEFGLEPDPLMYIKNFSFLLIELKRILKQSGGLWIEIYDKYLPNGFNRKTSKACIPERLCLLMTDYLEMYYRNDIILWKVPSRPESLKSRFSRKHTMLYYFTKSYSSNHYFDLESVKTPAKDGTMKNPGDVWIAKSTQIKGSNTASYSTDIIERAILAGCPKNGICMDPFNGIGTTTYIAKLLERSYLGIEMVKDSYEKSIELLKTLDNKLI